MIKAGDTVVCIKYDPFEISSGDFTDAPKVGDIEQVVFAYKADGKIWLSLHGWNVVDFDSETFRKISPTTFKNALTKELAEDFIEHDEKVIEQEKEIVEQ